MSYLGYSLSIGVMLALPLALATWLARRYRASWGLFGAGAATFVISQVGHIPFNSYIARTGWLPDSAAGLGPLLIVAAFYGLSAGFFEEGARYAAFRWWARDARDWADGMMMGAGHGGIESIVLGLTLALNVAALAGIRAGLFTVLVPAEQWPAAQAQADALFGSPLVLAVLPAIERAFALTLHLSLSLLVLQVFVRGQGRWWWFAVGWHALVDAVAVFLAQRGRVYLAEVALGVIALLSVLLIIRLRPQAAPPEKGPADAVETAPLTLEPPPLTEEKLDESRYV